MIGVAQATLDGVTLPTTQTVLALAPPFVVALLRGRLLRLCNILQSLYSLLAPVVWASAGALTASTGLKTTSMAPPMTVSIWPHKKSSTLTASSTSEHDQEQGQTSQHHQRKQFLKQLFGLHGQLRRKVHGRAEGGGSAAPSQMYGAASLGCALPAYSSCPLRFSFYPTSPAPGAPHTRERVDHCLGTVKNGVEDACEGLDGGKGHVVHAAKDLHKNLGVEKGWLRLVLDNADLPGHMSTGVHWLGERWPSHR